MQKKRQKFLDIAQHKLKMVDEVNTMGIMTVKDFAKKHGLCVDTAYFYVRNHCQLNPRMKVGKAVLYDEKELMLCLKKEILNHGKGSTKRWAKRQHVQEEMAV